MPPMRTMCSVKPMKTERTHEENQERAYIAASRRSDRSLEARVESARRASEIHKRRTGRSLRVTEQDVINEEMYEEEDDDLPMQYRRLTAHLHTQNADFNRRIQAYLINQVAMRQAVAGGGEQFMGPNQFMTPSAQYMNPGMLQWPQQQLPQFQGQMMPPQPLNRNPSSYRQQPYPMPQANTQHVRPNQHGRSMSVATPQDVAPYEQQQQSKSVQTSPVDAIAMEDRRMSLPAQNMLPQTPVSQHGQAPSPAHDSPALSRHGSSSNLTVHGQSPQQMPTPPGQAQQKPQPARQPSMTSPFDAGFEQQMQASLNPLTTQLPLESQQFLVDSAALDGSFAPMMPQTSTYSYNPNGKPKINMLQQGFNTVGPGLDQTLLPPQLDSNVDCFNPGALMTSPGSGVSDPMFGTHQTPAFNMNLTMPAMPMNFGLDDFDSDAKSSFHIPTTSGQVTPQELEWANLLNFQEDTTAS